MPHHSFTIHGNHTNQKHWISGRYPSFLAILDYMHFQKKNSWNCAWTYLFELQFVVGALGKYFISQMCHCQLTLLKKFLSSLHIFPFLYLALLCCSLCFTCSCISCMISTKSLASILFIYSISVKFIKSTTPFGDIS